MVRLVEISLRAGSSTSLRELHDVNRSLLVVRERLEAEDAECVTKQLVVAPLMHDGKRRGSVEVVLERRRELLPRVGRRRDVRISKHFAKAVSPSARGSQRLVGEIDRPV